MKKLKKVIAITLCLVMAIGNLSLAFGDEALLISAKPKDYEGHWAQATIQKWIDESKISGYPDGSFKPDENVTRAEFVKMVNSIIDYDVQGSIAYGDVKSGDWYYNPISIAQKIGYISGYSLNQFGPDDNITREQAAAILSRIQYLGENNEAAKKFGDNSSISTWAVGSVGAASQAGFINGYENGSFKPLNNLTRAEAITMLDNVLVNSKNVVVNKAGAELKDLIVEGNLIIAKTVGEGDVHLNNIEVKGNIYVYGGGMNSIYFNNVKVAKVEVEKDKVRLVFDDGSQAEEIVAGSETKLVNENGEIGKITITESGKVTLSGNFETVNIVGSSDITLDDATIQNLVVEQQISILGSGTIKTLTADANGILYESTVGIDKTLVGSTVTEKPAIISGGSSGGSSSGGTTSSYKLSIGVSYKPKDADAFSATFTPSDTYASDATISDYLVSEITDILGETSYTSTINSYLQKVNSRLVGFKIGQTTVYSTEGWNKIIGYLEGTTIKSGLSGLQDSLLTDGSISISDMQDVLGLYKSEDLTSNLTAIKANIKDYPFGSQPVTYNGKSAVYKINSVTKNNEEVANFILDNLAYSTKTVDKFFDNFGVDTTDGKTITIETDYDGSTSTITLIRVAQ